MKKRVFTGLFTAAVVALGAMNAFANDGMGINADPDASCKWDPHKVICMEDVEAKEYINDSDKVVTTFQTGTILEMNNYILRKGKDTGWADTTAVYDYGSAGTVYFETSKVQKYDPKKPIEIEQSEDYKVLTVRLPESTDEVYEYTVSDPEKIDKLTSENTGDQFVISFRFITETNSDNGEKFPSGSIHFEGKVDGNKNHDFTIDIKGDTGMSFITAIEKPLDFSEIKDLIEGTEEMYAADGKSYKIYALKDSRRIDMNGYEVIGIADTASQLHDGTVVYDEPVKK